MIDTIEVLLSENIGNDDLFRVSSIVFEIASANRFYSKMYAELYAELITKYDIMKTIFETNLEKFTALFNTIEYVDPNVNYDRFCEINKMNEKRKALASFYVNLMNNGIISQQKIMVITRNLLSQIYTFIDEDNKKNEVDELTENVALLYKKEIYENDEGEEYEQISGYTILEIIEKIANSKVKDYKSLTNKSLFKFMDMVDM